MVNYFVRKDVSMRAIPTTSVIAATSCQTCAIPHSLTKPANPKAAIVAPPRSAMLNMLCMVDRNSSGVSLFNMVAKGGSNIDMINIPAI